MGWGVNIKYHNVDILHRQKRRRWEGSQGGSLVCVWVWGYVVQFWVSILGGGGFRKCMDGPMLRKSSS